MANKKSFNSYLTRTKIYNLVIYGIAIVDTIIMTLRQKTQITFVATMAIKISTTIRSKVRILIAAVRLTTKPLQTINARRIKLTLIMKLIGKLSTTIDSVNSIGFISTARQKLLVTMSAKLSVAWNPIVATFLALSTHDTKDLSVMDVEDLSVLDYST